MSMFRTLRTRTNHEGNRRGGRALARALASAPTRASREELLQLQSMRR